MKLLDDTKITDIDDEGTDPIRDDDIVLVRYLKIVDHSNQKEFHVTNVILNHAWPTSTRPSDCWSCVELAKRIGHFYEICKSPNILLHGYGGDSNCLLVCALYVLVDQLMFENSVDIFNVVKYLNTQRCNTKINYVSYFDWLFSWSNKWQYLFCFRINMITCTNVSLMCLQIKIRPANPNLYTKSNHLTNNNNKKTAFHGGYLLLCFFVSFFLFILRKENIHLV